MITISVDYVEGVRFISDVKLEDKGERLNGVPVHYVDKRIENEPSFKEFASTLRLKRVEDNPQYMGPGGTYVTSPRNVVFYRLFKFILKIYWTSLRWSYDNVRLFKAIPHGEMFSWKYFTPYTWFIKHR